METIIYTVYMIYIMICVQNIYEIKIPKNRREMLKTEYKEEFLIAEKIELKTIRDHGTIKFVPEKEKFSQVENENGLRYQKR